MPRRCGEGGPKPGQFAPTRKRRKRVGTKIKEAAKARRRKAKEG